LDILLSLIGLIGSIPILFIAAILIKMEDGGPILFSQLRAGENGKPFRLLKLRTMCLEAEELLDRLVDIQNLESPAYKINNDPRVTKIVRFLRRWSIDEIPQFINVLKGEMSLVGPRPEEMKIVAIYKDFERQRLIVKPGMSGPMQINGRGSLSFNQRLLLELDYIQNYSLRWDLEIIFRTIPAILNGKGAY
jgi:lipopolysaccharide/colanic/teichoic acid biosynthesis glycosyltransferase